MKTDRFTREQIVFLIFASGCSNMGFNSIWAVYLAERSGWVAVSIGILLTIPFIKAILKVSQKYPENNIFDILEMSFGRIVYIIIVIINAIINIILGISIINFLAGTVKVYFLPLTPVWVIMLVVVSTALLFVNNKITYFGRTVELLTIWYIINYFTGFSLSFAKEFDFKNIYPIFDTTFLKFGEAVFFSLGSASEIILFTLVMVGHMPETKGSREAVIKGIKLWAFILPLAIFIMQGISGTEMLLRTSSVGVEISRAIYFGDFIRGLELFILATYLLICTLRLSLYLYCSWIPIKKVFRGKYSFSLLFLVSLVIFVLSINLNSYNDGFFISIFMDYYVLLPFVLIVLMISFIGDYFKKKNYGSDTG